MSAGATGSGWLAGRGRFGRGFGQLQRKLPSADGFLIPLVSLHDFLHQAVANDVAFVELDKADAFDAAQHFHGVDQAAAFSGRQIDLREVAGHHHFRVEALARQHHLHLLGGAVLRFVQNDEAVVQRAAAHERDGRHFDYGALQQLLHFVGVQHVVQRVVERAQIRVDFFLQIAGQKSQALAGFHRGPRKNDARHALVHQRRDRHGHGEIRLAGARRPDAEHQIVALDRVHVAALVHGFRRQRFLSEIALPAAVNQAAQRRLPGSAVTTRRKLFRSPLGKIWPSFTRRDIIFQNAGGANHVGLVAFDFERVVQQAGVTFRPFSSTRIFSSRVPNRDSMPRVI